MIGILDQWQIHYDEVGEPDRIVGVLRHDRFLGTGAIPFVAGTKLSMKILSLSLPTSVSTPSQLLLLASHKEEKP